MRKVNRRSVATAVTCAGAVAAAGPAHDGARPTVAPTNWPDGNPEPVIVVLFTPAAPDAGLAEAVSFCASAAEWPRSTSVATSIAARINRGVELSCRFIAPPFEFTTVGL